MPYNPDTGAWSYEDDSVEGRVKGLVDVNSPIIQQARTQGMQTANRRGLINSSIAAGASQDAAYKAAVPIATADANITNSKNLSAQAASQALTQGAQTIQGQKDIQTQSDIASRERLVAQLGSQEAVAAAERAAAKERLGLQLTSEEKRSADSLANALAIAKGQNDTSIRNTDATTGASVTNTNNTIDANKAINQATINSNTANWVATATNTARNNYNTRVNTIMSNPNISATDRAEYLRQAKIEFDADMRTISGVSNVQVTYTPPSSPGTPADGVTPGGAPAGGSGGTATPPAAPAPPAPRELTDEERAQLERPYIGDQR